MPNRVNDAIDISHRSRSTRVVTERKKLDVDTTIPADSVNTHKKKRGNQIGKKFQAETLLLQQIERYHQLYK